MSLISSTNPGFRVAEEFNNCICHMAIWLPMNRNAFEQKPQFSANAIILPRFSAEEIHAATTLLEVRVEVKLVPSN